MRLTDQELIDLELSVSDPEGLPGVSHDEPPEGQPFVEFQYDMRVRGTKVRCVYCKYPNHFQGVVVNYGNDQRRLVGRDCAETRHGVRYGAALSDFDAALERQAYLRRQRNVTKAAAQIYEEMSRLTESAPVKIYDNHLSIWRRSFSELAGLVRACARTGQELKTKFKVRDFESERARKLALGERFEEARAEAKEFGDTWQLFRTDVRNRGRLVEERFFLQSIPISEELRSYRDKLMIEFRLLASDGLTTKIIRESILRITDMKSEVIRCISQIEVLHHALSEQTFHQIANYAFDLAEETEAELAEYERRGVRQSHRRYRVIDGALVDVDVPGRDPLPQARAYSVSTGRLSELFEQALAL